MRDLTVFNDGLNNNQEQLDNSLRLTVGSFIDQFLVLASKETIAAELNPLTISQIPSENSNNATGTADRAASGASRPIRPNKTAM